MLVIPGGLGGVASIRASKASMDAIAFAAENGKFVAAICAGPTILADLKITDGKNVTCYPGCEGDLTGARYTATAVEQDGNIITACGPAASFEFGFAIVENFCGDDKAAIIREQMRFNDL